MPSIKLYNEDCLVALHEIRNVDLIVTSPPYYNARPEYSEWNTYEDYLAFIHKSITLMYHTLNDTGRIAINTADNYGRNPAYSLYADVVKIVRNVGFNLRGSIVWNKNSGGGKTSWGSWRSSSNPCIIDEHEMIIIANKEKAKIDNPRKIEKDLFLSCTHSIWKVNPETKRTHPAPFPINLPYRLISFYAGENAVVLDPFMGSGTTALACIDLDCDFVGIEKDTSYYALAEKRITAHRQQIKMEI